MVPRKEDNSVPGKDHHSVRRKEHYSGLCQEHPLASRQGQYSVLLMEYHSVHSSSSSLCLGKPTTLRDWTSESLDEAVSRRHNLIRRPAQRRCLRVRQQSTSWGEFFVTTGAAFVVHSYTDVGKFVTRNKRQCLEIKIHTDENYVIVKITAQRMKS